MDLSLLHGSKGTLQQVQVYVSPLVSLCSLAHLNNMCDTICETLLGQASSHPNSKICSIKEPLVKLVYHHQHQNPYSHRQHTLLYNHYLSYHLVALLPNVLHNIVLCEHSSSVQLLLQIKYIHPSYTLEVEDDSCLSHALPTF